jgi:phage gpG-like protein
MKVDVKIEDAQVQRYFAQLAARAESLRPLMADIGEHLAETTKQRFATSTAPDGSKWAANAQSTLLAFAGAFSRSFDKKGRLTSGGARRLSGKKPLIGESGRLGREINYRADDRSVTVGSAMVYAAIHQFGGQAGRARSVNIPARPFLGLSTADASVLVAKAREWLADAPTA